MHIMFVCTGNICRSPMGELLMSRYLANTTVQVTSAGTRGLPMHQIDPSSARLMDSVGIDSSGFRSRRLTREMAESADLILCFEAAQRKEIVTIAPMAVRYTFMLDDFANMCRYSAEHGLVKGLTIQERLQSVIDSSSCIRPIPAGRGGNEPRVAYYFVQHAQALPRGPGTGASADCTPRFNSIIYAS